MTEEKYDKEESQEELGMNLETYDDSSQYKEYKRKNRFKKFLKIVVVFIAVFVLASVGFFYGVIYPIINNTPELKGEYTPIVSSRIYDRNGKLIATLHGEENRIVVSIKDLPPHVWQAFVAAEDVRFFEHGGLDPRGLIRAVWTNLIAGELREGGSTITQQFVKNALLTQERTFTRKIKEAFLSYEVERRYNKMEILEMYMNQVYFGEGAYGIQTASLLYFGKDAKNLTISEAAVLASIPRYPTANNPFRDADGVPGRKNIVLSKMVIAGYLQETDRERLSEEKLTFHEPKKEKVFASYFTDFVLQELLEKYGADKVYKEGIEIYTTLDYTLQEEAEKSVFSHLPKQQIDDKGVQQPQAALVVIDPSTGEIRALVGGRGTDKYNRAVLAERQPGSAFKPFVYLAAFDMGLSPEALIEDKPISYGYYSPQNYARKFYGTVTLRIALEQSLNVVAVRLNQFVTPEKTIEYAKKMGISTLVESGEYSDANFAMALGGLSRGVTPLELTSAYGVIANKGVRFAPIAIQKVVDRNGQVLFEASPKGEQVIDPNAAATLADVMRGVVNRGTGMNAGIGRPAAGKTGTTDSYKDAWFVGFTPNLVAGVWVGNDNNIPLPWTTGGDLPAIIWGDFMGKAHKDLPLIDFPKPKPGDKGIAISKDGKIIADPKKALGNSDNVSSTVDGSEGTEENIGSERSKNTPLDIILNNPTSEDKQSGTDNQSNKEKPRKPRPINPELDLKGMKSPERQEN